MEKVTIGVGIEDGDRPLDQLAFATFSGTTLLSSRRLSR
jgi:hypothetical protein